jgi:hypothetical protein
MGRVPLRVDFLILDLIWVGLRYCTLEGGEDVTCRGMMVHAPTTIAPLQLPHSHLPQAAEFGAHGMYQRVGLEFF